jgi:xanthine dehydrogenase accessory factor
VTKGSLLASASVTEAARLPARTASPSAVLRAVADALEQGRAVVLATVLKRRGSTPATPGQKLALLGASELVGTVGGGALEQDVVDHMLEAARTQPTEASVRFVDLRSAYGMACGGSVEILIEPLTSARSVLVVGAGHVGCALAPLLVQVGFQVVLCDTRQACVDGALRLGRPQLRVVAGSHDQPEVVEALGGSIDAAAALVMTHDHDLDEQVLGWALGQGFALVGGVGSRHKAARLRARWATAGIAQADVDRLRMPLGVDIGARSPAEIAVSIVGELVAWRAQLARSTQGPGPVVEPPTPAAAAAQDD